MKTTEETCDKSIEKLINGSHQLRYGECYLQVVRQVVLLQGVSLEAVRRRVKVVVANPANETFGLRREIKSHRKECLRVITVLEQTKLSSKITKSVVKPTF